MKDVLPAQGPAGFPEAPSGRPRSFGRHLGILLGCLVLLALPFVVWFGTGRYQLQRFRNAAAGDYRARRDPYGTLVRKISSLPKGAQGELKRFEVSGSLDPSTLRQGSDPSSTLESSDASGPRYLESYHDQDGRLIVRILHRHVGGFMGSFWLLYTDHPEGFPAESFGLRYSPSDQLDPNWWVVETQ